MMHNSFKNFPSYVLELKQQHLQTLLNALEAVASTYAFNARGTHAHVWGFIVRNFIMFHIKGMIHCSPLTEEMLNTSISESSHLCAICAAWSINSYYPSSCKPCLLKRYHIPLGNPDRMPDGKPDGIVLYLNAGFRRSCFFLLIIVFVTY